MPWRRTWPGQCKWVQYVGRRALLVASSRRPSVVGWFDGDLYIDDDADCCRAGAHQCIACMRRPRPTGRSRTLRPASNAGRDRRGVSIVMRWTDGRVRFVRSCVVMDLCETARRDYTASSRARSIWSGRWACLVDRPARQSCPTCSPYASS
jgi:hypothetical protein